MRAAHLWASQLPYATLEPSGVGNFVLNPGERAIAPLIWHGTKEAKKNILDCSTHPDAPAGLAVLPGPCQPSEWISVVLENESPLPIQITERDFIAICTKEGETPTLDECALVHYQQQSFCKALDWSGQGKDSQREVPSPRSELIVVVIHLVPRFAAMKTNELESEKWRNSEVLTRTTTLVCQSGVIRYFQ